MNEFLIGLNCFVALLFFVALIAIVGWTRGRVRKMQQQLDLLTRQIAESGNIPVPASAPTATLPSTATIPASSELAQPPDPMPDQVSSEIIHPQDREATLSLEPTLLEPPKATRKPNPLVAWFTQMNIMVQIGLIVLFFGVAFLVKYAADQGWLSLELRLTGAALLGGALAGIGWRVRGKARGYGLALIGGGIGIDYIVTFAAYRLYELIPPSLAFAILVGLGVIYAVMALLNDAQILAFLALVGGLLAPLLASSGGGSHVMLFSYYFVINAGILAIAWFKSWRLLNLASFALTLLAAIGWGSSEYTPAIFNSSEPFLILFFLFYLAITVLTARRAMSYAEGNQIAISDVILLFANPLASFALQYGLVANLDSSNEFWMARSALVLALVYAALALGSNRSWRNVNVANRWVVEGFIFLATFFLAISFPLLYDERITAASWALLAVALHWLGTRRRQGWAHGWGILIRLAATAAFFADIGKDTMDPVFEQLPLFTNHIYIGAVILSLSSLLSAWLLHSASRAQAVALSEDNAPSATYRRLGIGMLAWGLFWWFGCNIAEMVTHIGNDHYVISSLVAFVVLTCLSAELIGTWLKWGALRRTLLLMLPMVSFLAFLQFGIDEPIWQGGNWYAWPLAVVAHFFVLTRFESWQSPKPRWQALYHAGGVWLLTFLLTRLLYQGLDARTTVETWRLLPLLLVPALVLAIVGIFTNRLPTLLHNHPRWYVIVAAIPLALFLVSTVLAMSVDLAGDSSPLPYLPILNPLTLSMIAVFAALWGWLRKLGKEGAKIRSQLVWLAKLAVGVLAFIAFNAGLARDIHHLLGVAFNWDSLFASEILQTTYAIVWSVISLVLMFWANRRGARENGWSAVWYFGAAVLALTVLKLFLVDLANTGAIARIVSFMGVGLLIIVIAYFAPIPTQRKELLPAETG